MVPGLLQNCSLHPSHTETCIPPSIFLTMCLAHGLEHCRQNVFNAVVALSCLYVVWAEGVGLGKGPLQSPLALIDGQGKISSTREMISRVGMAGNGSKDGIIRVFGILNSKGTKCCDILERIMGLELTLWAPKMTNNNKEEDHVSIDDVTAYNILNSDKLLPLAAGMQANPSSLMKLLLNL